MIKKSIASIFIVLIFFESIGCQSYNVIKMDDRNEIEKASRIRLTTVDNKEYILQNVMVEDSTISGNQWGPNKMMERRIEFPIDQITKIEGEKNFTSKITLFIVVIGIVVYIYRDPLLPWF